MEDAGRKFMGILTKEKMQVPEVAAMPIGAETEQTLQLCYHMIEPGEANHVYSIGSADFDRHMQMIAKLNSEAGAAKRKPVVTFDDGHLSNFEIAFPILEKYSARAIFFVTAGWIGKKPDVMTWEQLRELSVNGYEIQSHGWSHELLTHCSETELKNELMQSRLEIEDRLGVAIDAISFPGGRWNRRVARACAEAGYHRLYASYPWIAPRTLYGARLSGRLMVCRSTTAQQIHEWCTKEEDSFLRARIQNALQETLRFFVGDRRYISMWRALAVLRLGGTQDKMEKDGVAPRLK